MKLNILMILDALNHYASASAALVEMLRAHGVGIDTRMAARVDVADLYVDHNATEVEPELNKLRALAGLEPISVEPEPKPMKVTAEPKAEPVKRAKGSREKTPKPNKRQLSPEARERIAAAQKKRWENFRAAQMPGSTNAPN